MAADDRQLILWCREGREEGYRQLLGRYERYIYGLCYRLTGDREDALDLTQETFIRVLNGLGGVQANRPFKPWLRQVTVNACCSFLRRREPEGVSLEQPLNEEITLSDVLRAVDDTAGEVVWRDTRRLLREAMGRLPPTHRMVMVLRHQEDMSYQEIAAATGLPLGTVRTYLFRARERLRSEMSDYYGWEG